MSIWRGTEPSEHPQSSIVARIILPGRFLLALTLAAFFASAGLPALADEAPADDVMADDVADDQADVFELSLDELLNVDVEVATRSKMSSEDAPAIVSVVTQAEIENMGARDLADVMMQVPGFDVVWDNTVAVPLFSVRGANENGKVKVMIDGHSVIWPARYGPQFSLEDIPVGMISRIEVVRGPGSALYGAGAFSGVMNIITKEGGYAPSKLGVLTGSWSTVQPYGQFSYAKDDFKAYVYGEYLNTGGDDSTVIADASSNPENAARGFVNTLPGELTSYREHGVGYGRLEYKGFSAAAFFQYINEQTPLGAAYYLTDEDDVTNMLGYADLKYAHPILEMGEVSLRAYTDQTRRDSRYEVWPEETAQMMNFLNTPGSPIDGTLPWPIPVNGDPFPAGMGIYGYPSYNGSVYGGELMVSLTPTPSLELVAGFTGEYLHLWDVEHSANSNVSRGVLWVDENNDGIQTPDETYMPYPFTYFGSKLDITENGNWLSDDKPSRTVFALYGQGVLDLKELFSLDVLEGLTLTAGLRWDHYDDMGSTVNPRFGLVVAPIEKLYAKLLYGTAFRAPSFSELYAIGPAFATAGDLEPETIETWEFLVGYNFTQQFRSNVTLFYTELEDLIVNYTNSGSREGWGFEAEVRWMATKDRYAYINATVQDIKDTTYALITAPDGQSYRHDEYTPAGIPTFFGNVGVSWNLGIGCPIFNDLVLNSTVNFVGDRARSGENAWVETSPGSGEYMLMSKDDREDTPGRVLANLSITFRDVLHEVNAEWLGDLDLQFSIFNLFNANHRDPDLSGNRLLEFDYPRAGRTYWGKVSYAF